jgi:hypothetical protein
VFPRAAITFGLAFCMVILFVGAVVTDVLARGSRGSSGSHHSSGSRSSGFHSGLGTGSTATVTLSADIRETTVRTNESE